MTTPDSDVSDVSGEVIEQTPEAEVPEEETPEEENPRYEVSFVRLQELQRSPVPISPSKSKPLSEMPEAKALVREIAKNHGGDPEFIRSDMPIQEIIFRTLLAGGNKSILLTDLHYELTERWATPIRPIVVNRERLIRIMDTDTYYGFVRVNK
jgi:hypothetical protein